MLSAGSTAKPNPDDGRDGQHDREHDVIRDAKALCHCFDTDWRIVVESLKNERDPRRSYRRAWESDIN